MDFTELVYHCATVCSFCHQLQTFLKPSFWASLVPHSKLLLLKVQRAFCQHYFGEVSEVYVISEVM